MAETPTDTDRLEWMFEQLRRGMHLWYVTTRADVDALMGEDVERDRAPLPLVSSARAGAQEGA